MNRVLVSVVVLLSACPATPPVTPPAGACAGLAVGASCGTNAVCDAAGTCVGCKEGASCDTGQACHLGVTRCATGAPVCAPERLAALGSACAGGVCAANGDCVPCVDGMACDLGEACSVGAISCNSGAPTCTRARLKDSGAVCRPSTGPCDAAERCDGTSAQCPADEPAPDRTPCDDGLFCNGPDACSQGQCSLHAGNPCALPGQCSAAASACVACLSNADCEARVPQTGCFVATCQADGQCSTTQRHDDGTWQVNPVSSPEIQLAQGAEPREAVFDGENFLVLMTESSTGAMLARRVAQDGGVLEAAPFLLDPRVQDLAFGGGRYLAVSVEPPNALSVYNSIGGQYLDREGRPISAKFPVLIDSGANCGGQPADLGSPHVAWNGTHFMVVAQVSCGFLATGAILGGATWSSGTTDGRRPRNPTVYGRDGGFGLLMEDNFIGMGRTEVWGVQLATAGATPTAARTLNAWSVGAGGCCVLTSSLAWGNSTWLMASNRSSSTGRLDLLSNALVPTGTPIALTGAWGYPNYSDVELDFDGTNYLALVSGTGAGFRALRVNEAGAQLDPAQLLLPVADAGVLDRPQLASTRTGRWLLAYRKADGHAYARTFSTCP